MNEPRDFSKNAWEWGVATGALLFTLGSAPLGRFQPWLYIDHPDWVSMITILLPLGIMMFIVFLILAMIGRRPLRAALVFGGICVGLYLLNNSREQADTEWTARFVKQRVPMERVINEIGQKDGIIPLKGDATSLTYDSKVVVHREEDGKIWYLFVQYLHGVDNGFGYAWSPSNLSPPERAYPQICRTQPLGNGWFMFWST